MQILLISWLKVHLDNERKSFRENLHLISRHKTKQETKLRPHNTRLCSQAG